MARSRSKPVPPPRPEPGPRRRLEVVLREYGYADDVERFRELLMDTYAEMFRDCPVDEMLCQQDSPTAFVGAVRKRGRCEGLHHDVILRALCNLRKMGRIGGRKQKV